MKKCLFVLTIGIVFLLMGCSAVSKDSKNSALLEPSPILKFSDVPVPVGFKLMQQDSYSFESGSTRVGVLKYRGKANPELVVNFFKEQMPMYNWTLLNVIEYGNMLMNFDRDTETCIVDLLPKGNNITITISLGPKTQMAIKKPKDPIK